MTPEEQAAADAATEHQDDDAVELASLAVDDGKGGKMVPLSSLIGSKKTTRELQRRIKELEPIAARATEIDGKLAQAQPIIDAVLTNPKLRAEALRISSGSRPSGETTEQPADDEVASAHAEDSGWYLSDGTTPDVARARRVLNRIAGITRTQAEDVVRPYAGVTINDRAERHIVNAIAQTNSDGVPLATEQSIREVAAKLGPGLISNQDVVEIMLDNAAGRDRRMNRTPKAQEEPLYMAPAGSRRTRETVIDADLKDALARVGLTEDEFKASNKKIDAAGGKSVRLG